MGRVFWPREQDAGGPKGPHPAPHHPRPYAVRDGLSKYLSLKVPYALLAIRRLLALGGEASGFVLFFEEFFAGLFLGDDVGCFVGHGAAFATVTSAIVATSFGAVAAFEDFAGASAGFGVADDAVLF